MPMTRREALRGLMGDAAGGSRRPGLDSRRGRASLMSLRMG